jgi:hypothetical protein
VNKPLEVGVDVVVEGINFDFIIDRKERVVSKHCHKILIVHIVEFNREGGNLVAR